VLVIGVLAETWVFWFRGSQGAPLTGDEPHYLVEAEAAFHLTPQVTAAYRSAFAVHRIFDSSPASVYAHMQAFAGPHGIVGAHGLGLPLLLAPLIGFNRVTPAVMSFFCFQWLGLIYLHQRASRLVRLSRVGQVVFGVALVAPALWLAGTQIYPDLISGILLSCAFVEVAVAERDRRVSLLQGAVLALIVGFLPWLHIKNLLPAVITAVAFAAVAHRARAWRPLALFGALVGLGWVLLFAFNQYYFGHLLGLPQAAPALDGGSLMRLGALLFDRHQGLFIQVPTVVLGLSGLWLARRRLPWSAGASLLAVACVVLLNAGYAAAPYGGMAFAGRFQWTVLPMLLAWAPALLVRLEAAPRRLVALGACVTGLWVLQAVPILAGDHTYFQSLDPLPWDVSYYPGWWGPLDPILPQFTAAHRAAVGLVIELVIIAGLLALLHRLVDPRPLQPVRAASTVALAGIALPTLIAVVPRPLPAGPLSFSGTTLGAPIQAEAILHAGPAVPLMGIYEGQFVVTFYYTATTTTPETLANLYCSPNFQTTLEAVAAHTSAQLTAEAHFQRVTVRCPTGIIWVQLSAGPHSALQISRLKLDKLAN
jgi:hypothetical protein